MNLDIFRASNELRRNANERHRTRRDNISRIYYTVITISSGALLLLNAKTRGKYHFPTGGGRVRFNNIIIIIKSSGVIRGGVERNNKTARVQYII